MNGAWEVVHKANSTQGRAALKKQVLAISLGKTLEFLKKSRQGSRAERAHQTNRTRLFRKSANGKTLLAKVVFRLNAQSNCTFKRNSTREKREITSLPHLIVKPEGFDKTSKIVRFRSSSATPHTLKEFSFKNRRVFTIILRLR